MLEYRGSMNKIHFQEGQRFWEQTQRTWGESSTRKVGLFLCRGHRSKAVGWKKRNYSTFKWEKELTQNKERKKDIFSSGMDGWGKEENENQWKVSERGKKREDVPKLALLLLREKTSPLLSRKEPEPSRAQVSGIWKLPGKRCAVCGGTDLRLAPRVCNGNWYMTWLPPEGAS